MTFLEAEDFPSVQAAVDEAERSGGPSAVVMLGREHGFNGPVNLESGSRLAIRGQGARQTRLYHAGSYAGPIFRQGQAKRGGQFEGSAGSGPTPTYDAARDKGGLELSDFAIIDNDRHTQGRHGIYLTSTDDVHLRNLSFGMLTGTALKLGADPDDKAVTDSGRIRESEFQRIRIYRCGSGSPNGSPDVPAFILQNKAGSGDGTNQNVFNNFRFVYNEGRMLIRSPGATGGALRRTTFRDVQLHALADNKSWNPVQYFPFDMVTIEGDVGSTLFDTVIANGNRAGTAVFRMKRDAAGNVPTRLVVKTANTVNVHGDFCRVSEGDAVTLDGDFQGISGQVLGIDSGSGLDHYSVTAYGPSSPAGKVTRSVGKGSVSFNGAPVT